ncbi:MAG: SDR family oxidoreductase [Bacteroidota bacterium]
MKNKTILITGATDGIGKQTAIDLAKLEAKIIIHGRDEESCKNTIAKITEETGNSDVDFAVADLSSLTQVNEMAKSITSKYERLDVLINNAGVYENEKIFTIDGYENTFAINHLSHFLLTIKLLDLLKTSSPTRIINVSSIAHSNCDFDIDNLNSEKYFDPYNAYAISKAANVLFTYKLAEEVKNSGVIVNVLHPGVITTKLLYKGFSMTGASLKDGARTSVYLASSKEVENVSGKYFIDLSERNSASFTYNTELQEKLWDKSLKMIENYL